MSERGPPAVWLCSAETVRVAQRMTGDPHFGEIGQAREDLDRQLEVRGERNRHDVGHSPAAL